uniref:Uncharacterized protein n=1 Tax=Picea sitchensis TaxID=3332 RepID=A9P0S6_PICSI|nr:unknown [Picea sitchensis]
MKKNHRHPQGQIQRLNWPKQLMQWQQTLKRPYSHLKKTVKVLEYPNVKELKQIIMSIPWMELVKP